MNPVTRALLRQIDDPALHEFVRAWDALETLTVAIYRGEGADREQSEEFAEIKAALGALCAAWQPQLEAHWRATRIQGEAVSRDPFLALIELPDADSIVGNWAAMQTLPAAREALNGMLMERIEAASEK